MQQIDFIRSGIVFGKLRTVTGESGCCFERFTERQKEIYAQTNSYFPEPFFNGYFARNCGTDANIMLDFHTDSRSFGLGVGKFETVNGSQNNCFDVLVNGRLRYHGDAAQNIALKLAPGRKRITVFFPYFGKVWLKKITLDENSTVESAEKKGLWLALGDSITHGGNASFPSRTYVSRLATQFDYEIVNQGNSGYIYNADVIDPSLRPDVVTVAYGINDAGRKNAEQYYNDMDRYYGVLTRAYPQAKIFMLSPIWAATMDRPEKREKYRNIYAMFDAVSKKYGLRLIDGRKLVPHHLNYYQDKAVHPNDRGFGFYASRLGKIIAAELG